LTADAHEQAVRNYLVGLMHDQAEIRSQANHGRRFVALLRAGLGSLRFHLRDARSQGRPRKYPAACGWHTFVESNVPDREPEWCVPQGSKSVGFLDADEGKVYLLPEMAKIVARQMARDQGATFENIEALGRELADAGLIQTTTEKRKVKVGDGVQEKMVTRTTVKKRIPYHGSDWFFEMNASDLFGDDEPVIVTPKERAPERDAPPWQVIAG
jgi:hypothetical protein